MLVPLHRSFVTSPSFENSVSAEVSVTVEDNDETNTTELDGDLIEISCEDKYACATHFCIQSECCLACFAARYCICVTNMEIRAADTLQIFGPSEFRHFNSLSLESTPAGSQKALQEAQVVRIAEIIASYRVTGPIDHYEDVMKPRMLETLRQFVSNQEPINMVVPAYPFKSPNHETKVLGPDPDVGTRVSLQHLNSIGARIKRIYPPGGHVTIVSDGVCYNDLLHVSDEEVFQYARGLHRITERLGLQHLKFEDIFLLLDGENSPTTAEEYAQRVGALKERLFSTFLPPGYDLDEAIKKDQNTLLTYRGYIKFLEQDLATYYARKNMSKSAIKKCSAEVARSMIKRGKAFSALVATKSPLHVRLSIHVSDNTTKLSVSLLPHEQYRRFAVTPWHNTPYLDTTSASLNLGRKPVDSEVSYRVCQDGFGLKFLCADVSMYRIVDQDVTLQGGQEVRLEPLYPFGLKVQVPKDMPITRFGLANVAQLAKLHSPVIFEGLGPMQSTKDIINDLHSIAGNGLSVITLHEWIAASIDISSVASYFVQLPTSSDGEPMLLPFTDGAALDDARYCVLHQWEPGNVIVSDNSKVMPVHLNSSALRVIRPA